MSDEAALYRKIKHRIKRKVIQQCPDAPGELAVYVTRRDNGKPLADVQVSASGPTSSDGQTDALGWMIFFDRKPGDYDAGVTLPPALSKFRLEQPTRSGTVACAKTKILQFEVSPPPKVGVALSFHAVLFKKDEFPASKEEFAVLPEPEFATLDMLADGESQAVIRIHLVKLDDRGKLAGRELTPATAAEHFDEGNVVLKLSSGDFGRLTYGTQSGTQVSVPVKDISTGKSPLDKTKGVVFTTSRQIGPATLSASITGNAQYDYVQSFDLPRGSRERPELALGSRTVRDRTLGYDSRKVQWFLRKAGFLAYDEVKVQKDGPSCEWSDIEDILLDGDFGPGSARCLRDFQRVARGAFRNQTRKDVPVTLSQVSTEVTPAVIAELLEWRAQGYTVEPHNGVLVLKVTEGGAIDAEAKIVYGALVQGDDPKGYVELVEPVGSTACHWEGRRIVVADAIRSAIKLFKRRELLFRLHDADPEAILDHANMHSTFVTRVTATVRTLRGEQKAASTGATARDVQLYDGYRTVAQQNALYAKGRTADGVPCKHGEEVREVGTCATHEKGLTVTGAKGDNWESWHQFGVAVDLVFNTEFGNANWGEDKNWTHNGDVAKANSLYWGGDWTDFKDLPHIQLVEDDEPGDDHKKAYKDTDGTELEKLQAVWDLLP